MPNSSSVRHILPTHICAGLLTLLAALPLPSILAAQPQSGAPETPTPIKVHLVTSPYQRGTTKIRVLLPDNYQPTAHYRCLYVLPVEAADQHHYGDGLQECLNTNIHNQYSLICVAPTFSDLPWYADHPTDRQLRQETHFTQFVRPYVEQRYPVIRAPHGRLLVGFSKSGWGAFSLLLRNPELFGRAAAWDAPLMQERPDQYGMGPIFGSQANFEHYQISRLLAKNARQLADRQCLVHVGYGNFRDHHQRAHTLMDQLGIRHAYADGPPRKHDWHSGWLPDVVQRLAVETK